MGQSKDDLRLKFGAPVAETFVVRPGVGATAAYSEDGRIKELVISPQTNSMIKSRNMILDRSLVMGIIDTLVPPAKRGKLVMGTFINMTCLPEVDCAGSEEAYQNLTIYFNSGRDGGIAYAVIPWKR